MIGISTDIAQSLTEIRILSEDQHSLVLEFTPKIHTEQVAGSHGTIFTQVRFFESQVTYDSEGRADFFRAVLLLLPSPKYSIRVLTSDFQIKDTMRLVTETDSKIFRGFGCSRKLR